MRSITTLDLTVCTPVLRLQAGEAPLSATAATGVLTIEVEDSVEPGVNMVFPAMKFRNRLGSTKKL